MITLAHSGSVASGVRRALAHVLATCALLLLTGQASAQTDPLPSWNDGAAKKAIVEFVQATTTQGSPRFVPPAERIATFDQDGTLWVSHPMYSQVMYCLDRPMRRSATRPATGRCWSTRGRATAPG